MTSPTPLAATATADAVRPAGPAVRHLHQILLWPLRRDGGQPHRTPWQVLRDLGEASPWREVVAEYIGDSARFHERHYHEFVTFLPCVQRILYGEGRKAAAPAAAGDCDADAPMRVFRREYIAQLRVVARPGDAPVTLEVIHVDLYFFFDVDVVLLNLELGANDLTLVQAQEQVYCVGRAYPAGWDASGRALHTANSVEWIDAQGAVMARSDAQQRELFASPYGSGQALIVIGDARSSCCGRRDRGVLAQFRHQHFLLFPIAHFQKAALPMSSDRLVEALRISSWATPTACARSGARSAAASRAFCASRTATGSTRSLSRRGCARCSTCAPATSAPMRCTTWSRCASPT